MTRKPPEKITVDGVALKVVVERKNVKNVNARLRGSELHVSAPPGMKDRDLEAAVAGLARRLLRRAHARRANEDGAVLALARKVAARFPECPTVRSVEFVSNQRSRWGSYSPKTETIRLHVVLGRMPRWVLEAVLAHELAHVFHRDHSPVFWELLRSVCPETERANAFLCGVGWLSQNFEHIPLLERELLIRSAGNGAVTLDQVPLLDDGIPHSSAGGSAYRVK